MALRPSTKLFKSHHLDVEFRGGVCLQQRRKEIKTLAMRFQGVDNELQEILDANMDQVSARRRAREAFKDIQLGIDHILFKTPCDGLKLKESYEVNSRGLEIFCKSWLPGAGRPKAAVFYCHGIARKLASSGYGVFAMDYPGFSLSEGLHCYIPSFDGLVDDVIEQYSKIKELVSSQEGDYNNSFAVFLFKVVYVDCGVMLHHRKVVENIIKTESKLMSHKK
ncbi:Serine aminopeptidase, S33 [Sesbania bispinosa]|nr:Serine aminopeptidase, S33 [Sesbania bispinosa]